MSCGKYSPTVSASYGEDQGWWEKHKNHPLDLYDRDGYDWYGYNEQGIDRAGYSEEDYLLSGEWVSYGEPGEPGYSEEFEYTIYENVRHKWSNKIIGGEE